jgi:replicative DNA helicase
MKKQNQCPQNNDLEQMVLGAVLMDKHGIDIVANILDPEDFYNSKHQVIYTAVITLSSKSFPIDMVTVSEQLIKTREIDFVGMDYLAELTNRIASTANLEYHAMLVKQKSIRRRVINVSSELFDKGFDNSIDDLELLEIAENEFSKIGNQTAKNAYQDPAKVAREIIVKNEILAKSSDAVLGIPISDPVLNKLISGWQGGKFIVIAARPAMGKTTFVTNEARFLGIGLGIPVGFFSLEMSNEELVAKIVSAEVEVDDKKIKDMRTATESEKQRINTGLERFADSPIYINDTAQNLQQIKSAARLMVREKGVKLIVVDYIQLISNSIKGGNREQEVSQISRQLKLLSRELNIPVIALSQLNRSVESTSDKRPFLSHLRESGAIEQDADLVGFLYRPEYYGFKDYTDPETGEEWKVKGLAEFIIAKHRAGELKNVPLKFKPQFSKFTQWQTSTFDLEPEEKPYNGTITKNGHAVSEEPIPF